MSISGRIIGRLVLLGLGISSLAGIGSAQEADALAVGQDLWRSCSSCHGVPDQRIAQDADWLRLNLTTTCISGEDDKPETRRALNAYLTDDETLRPTLVNEDYRVPAEKIRGEIHLPATAGSAYLKADRASIRAGSPSRVRLSWQASEAGTTLEVPAGQYRVINYAFYRVDEKKRRWSISGSSAEGCAELAIGPEKKVAFELLPEINGKLSAVADEAAEEADESSTEYSFGFFMTNRRGERMSIACNGKLVNPTWVIRDAAGEIIERGKFEVT